MTIELTKEEYTDIIDALIFLSSEVCYEGNHDDKLIEIAKKIKDGTGADCKDVYIYRDDELYERPEHMKKVKEWFDIRIENLSDEVEVQYAALEEDPLFNEVVDSVKEAGKIHSGKEGQ